MTRTHRPVHAVPSSEGVEHRADSWCSCRPLTFADLEEPARIVFVHRAERTPGAPAVDAGSWTSGPVMPERRGALQRPHGESWDGPRRPDRWSSTMSQRLWRRHRLLVAPEGFTPTCMDPDELAMWRASNRKAHVPARSPCVDCDARSQFYLDSVANDRCNGKPRAHAGTGGRVRRASLTPNQHPGNRIHRGLIPAGEV